MQYSTILVALFAAFVAAQDAVTSQPAVVTSQPAVVRYIHSSQYLKEAIITR
jgi:hypothetical protein